MGLAMSRLLDPDTPPIGRQPDRIVIIPSKRQPWYGAIIDGRRFTRQQQNALIERGADIATAHAMTVKRQATHREMWWPTGQLPPVFAFECPIVGRRANGRVSVIAPDGQPVGVFSDGWAHRPYRRPKLGGE